MSGRKKRNHRNGEPPAYQWYAGDALANEAVTLMSLEQEGAYRRLLDFHWREGSIPASEASLRLLLKRATAAEFRRIWAGSDQRPGINARFTSVGAPEGRLVNERLARERLALEAHRVERSESGSKGAETRWGVHGSAMQQPLATDAPANGSRSDTSAQQPLATDSPASASASASSTTDLHPTDEDVATAGAVADGGALPDIGPDPLGSAKAAVRKVVQRHLDDAMRLLDDLNAARLRAIPRSRPIRPTYSSLQGIAERLASGATVDECVHVIAVGEAEVRADAKCAQWFDAVSPWRPENFQRKLARDPATVTAKSSIRPSGALDPSMTGNTPDSWGF